MNKPVIKSRTIWINCITVAVGICGFLAGHEVIMEYPNAVAALVVAQGLLNIALRFITVMPVGK
jgi:nitrate reductase gamma subunit